MKKTRKIVAGLFGMIGLACSTGTMLAWHSLGAGWWSLIAALVFYLGSTFVLWVTIDETLKEREQKWQA